MSDYFDTNAAKIQVTPNASLTKSIFEPLSYKLYLNYEPNFSKFRRLITITSIFLLLQQHTAMIVGPCDFYYLVHIIRIFISIVRLKDCEIHL